MPPREVDGVIDHRLGPLAVWRRSRKRVPAPRPRGRPVSVLAREPHLALDLADFQELRRQGLFSDDGRNPPPSWWAR
ncbi:MAG: hypothetical protein KBG48_08390 [Kofleriaceae bacterium]|jgi:hypothetical protein|nr:hypothetical protein [Kofleriaceae bacterium]MBP9167390.1 hypothetical protein [Kofleriaceae bacterium]MBP9860730.1 hypothetical protein [Kofleriaceae bacterium]